MNCHLNVYKPYCQPESHADAVEINLARALVIAMQNNSSPQMQVH